MRRLLALMCGVGLMAACGGGTDTGDPPFTTTTTSTSTSVVTAATTVVTVEVVAPEACRVEPSDGPTLRSFPVDGSVESLDVSGNCMVAVVANGEVLTFADDTLVPVVTQSPFDRAESVFFTEETLWLGGRSGDCFVLGVLDGDSWHEIVYPAGMTTCGDEGGFAPIGVIGSGVIFARFPMGKIRGETRTTPVATHVSTLPRVPTGCQGRKSHRPQGAAYVPIWAG